jgi:N-methylhydantoinase B
METSHDFDPVQVEVWRHLLASVAEEMGTTLERTAYSPNIKERLDYSCALFDGEGRLLAQAAHIPVHLGAMPLMLENLRPRVRWSPGTMWLCNDPRVGGTHLPDLTLVAPVYLPGSRRRSAPVGYVASRAHHADIGGLTPGSLPLSTELFHEGLILSPVRLVERGRVREEIRDLVCANSRTPLERRGDLAAQVGANETGIRRFHALLSRYGLEQFQMRTLENIAFAARSIRAAVGRLPLGVYRASDVLDDDGAGNRDIPIVLTLTIEGDGGIHFDFTGTAAQVRGSLNATEAITRSACYYAVRCLVQEEIPTNAGCFADIAVTAPEGSLVNARFPAAVAAGNVETSQRIVDVCFRALAQAAPELLPAASQGTMNNVTIGGFDPDRNRPFAYYETLAGGAGASPLGPGLSAVHSHMTNTRNTPVEALESHYPLRVLEYGITRGTGGVGEKEGGSGIVRRVLLLAECRVSLLTERRIHAPFGTHGGGSGACGWNTRTAFGGSVEILPGKWSGDCPTGTVVTVQTPGGGGWGTPKNAAESMPGG